jgi:hypothetical protein
LLLLLLSALARSLTIATCGAHEPPPLPRHSQRLAYYSAAPLDAGVSFVTRFVFLATTCALRLLRATLDAAKRLLLRCFCRIATKSDVSSAAARKLPATQGISVMREAEPTAPTTTTVKTATALLQRTSVETVRLGLHESSVTSPVPTSPSSPSRSSSTSVETSHSSSALSTSDDAALEKQGDEEPTDAVTSPLLVGSTKTRRLSPFPALDEPSESDAKHTRSLTSQQDLDQRRNSFSAMTADGRAQLRRRSHDLTDYASFTMPPPGANTGFLHARSKNHVHMRMYGKADTVAGKSVSARQEEGAPLVDVLSPASRTIWCRGQPVMIEWAALDADVESVQIELLEEGSSATTMITRATPNTGSFWYPKVPWGMQSGPTYFLRVSSVADPARYMTTGFFSIGTEP